MFSDASLIIRAAEKENPMKRKAMPTHHCASKDMQLLLQWPKNSTEGCKSVLEWQNFKEGQ